jgi:hypothetical protein
MLRMVAYDTRYFNGPYFGAQGANQFPAMLKIRNLYVQYFNDLELYRKGLLQDPPPPPCNRAYSRLVGWLGVWDHGDLETIPGGRMLLPAIIPNQQPGLPMPQPLQPQAVVGSGSGYPFGPATVERDADFTRITVDLCSTIPELDSTGRIAPFGPIELGIEVEGTYQHLVTVVPDSGAFEADYRRTAGLIDIASTALAPVDGQPLTASQYDSNPLVLKATSYTFDKDASPSEWTAKKVVALTENPLNAQTNTRGMYVDEPDALKPGPTSTFTVEVRDFGASPRAQTGLVVSQYDEAFAALSGDNRALLVFYRAPTGDWLPIDSDTVVDATAGSVTLGIRGAAAAVNGRCPTSSSIPWHRSSSMDEVSVRRPRSRRGRLSRSPSAGAGLRCHPPPATTPRSDSSGTNHGNSQSSNSSLPGIPASTRSTTGCSPLSTRRSISCFRSWTSSAHPIGSRNGAAAFFR